MDKAEPTPLATLCQEPLEVGPAPSLRTLEGEELELRAALLEDAQIDDEWTSIKPDTTAYLFADLAPGDHPLSFVAEGESWFIGQALGELRLLERRLHQIGESMPAKGRRK